MKLSLTVPMPNVGFRVSGAVSQTATSANCASKAGASSSRLATSDDRHPHDHAPRPTAFVAPRVSAGLQVADVNLSGEQTDPTLDE